MQTASPIEQTKAPRHALGIITPSGNTVVERVTIAILRSFPDISCHFSRTAVHGNQDRYPNDYDWASMMEAARLLGHARPDILCWSGSKAGSIAFDLDRKLCERIEAVTGCRATTSTIALAEVLCASGAKSFGLVSPYTSAYQQKIIDTFAQEGFRCVGEAHAGLTDNLSYASLPSAEILGMADVVAAHRPDAIIAWCTNLLAAPLAREIELRTGIPFYDSAALAVWHPLKLLGMDTGPGGAWGSLFAHSLTAAPAKP
jgi:maleate isomerase